MRVPKQGFTIVIDGIVLCQVLERSRFTGRSRSQEVCHLLSLALSRVPDNYDGWQTEVFEPVRTSINLDSDLRSVLEGKATELRVPVGRLVNMLLKFIIQSLTDETARVMFEVQPVGQEPR